MIIKISFVINLIQRRTLLCFANFVRLRSCCSWTFFFTQGSSDLAWRQAHYLSSHHSATTSRGTLVKKEKYIYKIFRNSRASSCRIVERQAYWVQALKRGKRGRTKSRRERRRHLCLSPGLIVSSLLIRFLHFCHARLLSRQTESCLNQLISEALFYRVFSIFKASKGLLVSLFNWMQVALFLGTIYYA